MEAYKRGVVYKLKPNPYYPAACMRPNLHFVVNRVPELSKKLFDQEETDITGNTSFPGTELTAWHARPEFRLDDSPIFMALEFNPEGQECLKDLHLRHALFHALDRSDIAEELKGIIVPAKHVGPLCFAEYMAFLSHGYDRGQATERFRLAKKTCRPLRIVYNNYYPNRLIVDKIQHQLLEVLDLHTAIYPIDFPSAPKRSWDLMLTLRLPAYDHPHSVLELYSFGVRQLGGKGLGDQFDGKLKLIREGLHLEMLDAVKEGSLLLEKNMTLLPLFTGRNVYLMRNGVKGFRFPQNANFEFSGLQL
jgi:ABC-type oligopeptide transport system substrate-binding subunit